MSALPRAFRRRARRGGPRRRRRTPPRSHPAATARRRAVHRGSGRADGRTGMTSPYDVLSRITSNRQAPQPAGERCEMCSESIAEQHQHVVNVAGRQLVGGCRGCYLLFTDSHAQLRYRSVPDRYLSFPDFALDRRTWELLQIPVGLAFFFRNSALERTVAFYPGPAGATESELDLEAWSAISAAEPRVGLLADDVEALLVRVPSDAEGDGPPECYLVPI